MINIVFVGNNKCLLSCARYETHWSWTPVHLFHKHYLSWPRRAFCEWLKSDIWHIYIYWVELPDNTSFFAAFQLQTIYTLNFVLQILSSLRSFQHIGHTDLFAIRKQRKHYTVILNIKYFEKSQGQHLSEDIVFLYRHQELTQRGTKAVVSTSYIIEMTHSRFDSP